MKMESLQAMIDKLDSASDADEFSRLRESVECVILKSREIGLICQLGAIYRKRKLWRDAENVLQEAKRLEPSRPEPHRSLGLLFMNRDDLEWKESLKLAKEALETSSRL